MALTRAATDYLPGDIVAWDLGQGIMHIGIVSDRTSPAGAPLVAHNIGAGAREEDILFRFTVTGHYRMPRPRPGRLAPHTDAFPARFTVIFAGR